MSTEDGVLETGKEYWLLVNGQRECKVMVVDLCDEEDFVTIRAPDGHLENVFPEELQEI